MWRKCELHLEPWEKRSKMGSGKKTVNLQSVRSCSRALFQVEDWLLQWLLANNTFKAGYVKNRGKGRISQASNIRPLALYLLSHQHCRYNLVSWIMTTTEEAEMSQHWEIHFSVVKLKLIIFCQNLTSLFKPTDKWDPPRSQEEDIGWYNKFNYRNTSTQIKQNNRRAEQRYKQKQNGIKSRNKEGDE